MSLLDWLNETEYVRIAWGTSKKPVERREYVEEARVIEDNSDLIPVTKIVEKNVGGNIIRKPVTVWVEKKDLQEFR